MCYQQNNHFDGNGQAIVQWKIPTHARFSYRSDCKNSAYVIYIIGFAVIIYQTK
jgi:hypothetical protein